ncbi:carbonate dehydratase [Candidatus Pandoraea novymonadis]|uniref:carbonic anhydrase n=1 Tax=Candidatus Pandoraea novymonadis TaxID=1808959 RepID=A0ABX5FDF8_9BURK|nr:carbonate dehydratase [Candidatus Pandoraea novymonadis]PSB91724.1 Carbonic anhydrase 2 [Candidatus Pandoraea novymonadis]
MNNDHQPLIHLLDNNRAWVARVNAEDPTFFECLSRQQAPQYLWIGCSDSRVPANQITGLAPGEIFVHRNIANIVVQSDLNVLSVLQFAVEVLKVRHIMVVGHYGCSGVGAVLDDAHLGLVDNWLRHVRNVHERHRSQIDILPSPEARHDRLCELNVIEQVVNICRTTVLQDAWARQQPVTVHGWVYGLRDGLVRDLGMSVNTAEALLHVYNRCVSHIFHEQHK